MTLEQLARLYAGGPGSGCDPEAARQHGEKCGRPETGSGTTYVSVARVIDRDGNVIKPGERGKREKKDISLQMSEKRFSIPSTRFSKRQADVIRNLILHAPDSIEFFRLGNHTFQTKKAAMEFLRVIGPQMPERGSWLDFGGPGSGCDPEAARRRGNECGRPEGGGPAEPPGMRRKASPSTEDLTKAQDLREGLQDLVQRLQKREPHPDKPGRTRPVIRGPERRRLQETGLTLFREMQRLEKGEKKSLGRDVIVPPVAPKRPVKQKWTSPHGYEHTILRPRKAKGIEISRGPGDPYNRPHRMKGAFYKVRQVESIEKGQDTTEFATSKSGAGVTLFVHRYRKPREYNFVIREITVDPDNWKRSIRILRFKNIGKGQGLLRKRYGVTVSYTKKR